MGRLLSFTMSILILMQSANIGLDEFSKFDSLLEHAQFHKQQYGDSFFDFLAEHYGSKAHKHDHDGQSHENLPFKHHDCSHFHTFIAENIDFCVSSNPGVYLHKPIFFYKESNSIFENTSIFQPPKVA